MSKQGRKPTNEWEFQGRVLEWLNQEIDRRSGLALDKTTQEKPRVGSGKRSDVVVWRDRATESSFLAVELKAPNTAINDPVFFADAIEKARHWKAPYFAIWNLRAAELYKTPTKSEFVTPADAIKRWGVLKEVSKLEDWLKDEVAHKLRTQAVEILDAAWEHSQRGPDLGYIIDAEIFVERLSETLANFRTILYKEIKAQSTTSTRLRKKISQIAAQQGFKGFVSDIDYAIAGQIGYRFIGQILFYHALRRKQSSLPPLIIDRTESIPSAFRPFWNEVRRFDYEALFKQEPIEEIVLIPEAGQALLRGLIHQLSNYDWASLTDDVLGAIFEQLIPREEQLHLGQFYTPRHVSDFVVALTADGEQPLILDPGCGSGTFLMSGYDYLVNRTRIKHKDALSIVWGFDLSPFAAELAAINLYRQDLSGFDNFPRIVPGNFFDRQQGERVDFPPPRVVAGVAQKVPVPIPHFDCIVGNPPYLRSQNQDDLDPKYRKQLFQTALNVGIKAEAKTDLFAFFIYHSMQFMKPGARLGFVTPASWMTSDYAISLQQLLMRELRLVALVSSSAESFFPQVDVNAVLLIAERVERDNVDTADTLRFVNLKQPIATLVGKTEEYWKRIVAVADEITSHSASMEDDRMRIKLVSLLAEKAALDNDPTTPRNWSKYMRAPLSYFSLFGDVS